MNQPPTDPAPPDQPERHAEAVALAVLPGGRGHPDFEEVARIALVMLLRARREARETEGVAALRLRERMGRLEWLLDESIREVARQRDLIAKLLAGLDGQDRFIAELAEAVAREDGAEGAALTRDAGAAGRH